jgi:hypothetical protein
MYLLAISGYSACAQKRRQSKKMGNEGRIKSTMPTKATRGEARAGGTRTNERTNERVQNAVKSSIKRNKIKAERRERETPQKKKSRDAKGNWRKEYEEKTDNNIQQAREEEED